MGIYAGTKKEWRVRPVHPVFRTRTYLHEDKAHEAATVLTTKFGVSCEVLYGHDVQYEVIPLPFP